MESSDKKISIIQNALEKYIVNDTSQSPNYRRGAVILKHGLSTVAWDDIANHSSYFLCMMHDALKKLNLETPNEDYEHMLTEIDDWIEN
jgi:hypothetical protein